MSVEIKTDYVEEGIGFLRQGLKERPNIEAALSAFLSHAQLIENCIAQLQDGLLLKNATGAVLDNYGDMVGVSRQGQTDEVYKLFILASIAANHGDATLQTTIQLVQKLFDTPDVFVRHPLVLSGGNGVTGAFVGFAVGSPKLPVELWPIAEKLIAQNIGGGVSIETNTTFDSAGAFAFSSATSPATYIKGWGSVSDSTTGGKFATFI